MNQPRNKFPHTLVFSQEVWELLERKAKEQSRSVSNYIEMLVRGEK